MTQQTLIEPALASPDGSEPGEVDVNQVLSEHFGAEVVDWDAHNIDIYWEADQRNSWELRNKVGGALVVICNLFDGQELVSRIIEIDNQRRPISEEAITTIGAVAIAKPSQYRLKLGKKPSTTPGRDT